MEVKSRQSSIGWIFFYVLHHVLFSMSECLFETSPCLCNVKFVNWSFIFCFLPIPFFFPPGFANALYSNKSCLQDNNQLALRKTNNCFCTIFSVLYSCISQCQDLSKSTMNWLPLRKIQMANTNGKYKYKWQTQMDIQWLKFGQM